MLLHHSHFIGVEGGRLFEDGQGNPCLAYVVKHSRERQPLAIRAGQSDLLTEGHGDSHYKQAVLICLAMVHANGLDPSRQTLRLDFVDDCVAG